MNMVSWRMGLLLSVTLSARAALAGDDVPMDVAQQRPVLRFQPQHEGGQNAEVKATAPPSDEIARIGLLDSAFGTPVGKGFAGLEGTAKSRSQDSAQAVVLVGGSPLRRFTLHGRVGRDSNGRFAPELTAHWMLAGEGSRGLALGIVGRYKTEGFSEAGGEAELGVTQAWRSKRFHLDTNLVGGLGVEEEEVGEMDVEGKARLAFDLLPMLRFGAVAQLRTRVAGDRELAGGHLADVMGGPELQAWAGPLLIAVSGGPTTVGVAQGVGAYGTLTVAVLSGF